MNSELGHEFDWDSEIEHDSSGYILLPEGDYLFTVTNMERGVYEPKEGAKLPACKMATLTLTFDSDDGETTVRENLYLHSRMEGKLCAFFASIGQRKKGERIRMNWSAVPGATGMAHLYVDEYPKKDGTLGKSNKVKYFIEFEAGGPASGKPTPPKNDQDWTKAADNAPQAKWKPGEF